MVDCDLPLLVSLKTMRFVIDCCKDMVMIRMKEGLVEVDLQLGVFG